MYETSVVYGRLDLVLCRCKRGKAKEVGPRRSKVMKVVEVVEEEELSWMLGPRLVKYPLRQQWELQLE